MQLGGLLVLAALLSGAGFFADALSGEPTPEAGDRYGEGRDPKYGL